MRLRERRLGSFELVRAYLSFATRLLELELRLGLRVDARMQAIKLGFELAHARAQRLELAIRLRWRRRGLLELQVEDRHGRRLFSRRAHFGQRRGGRLLHLLAPRLLGALRLGGRALDRLADLVARGGARAEP